MGDPVTALRAQELWRCACISEIVGPCSWRSPMVQPLSAQQADGQSQGSCQKEEVSSLMYQHWHWLA